MLLVKVFLTNFLAFLILMGFEGQAQNRLRNHEIPINIAQNILFITLIINDSLATFIIDTGATVSLLDEKQASKYDFVCHESQGKGKISGLAGVNTLQLVSGTRVRHGRFKLKGFKFYSCNLDSLHEFFERRNIFILGIIGADFLIKYNAVIDYENKTLLLHRGHNVMNLSQK